MIWGLCCVQRDGISQTCWFLPLLFEKAQYLQAEVQGLQEWNMEMKPLMGVTNKKVVNWSIWLEIENFIFSTRERENQGPGGNQSEPDSPLRTGPFSGHKQGGPKVLLNWTLLDGFQPHTTGKIVVSILNSPNNGHRNNGTCLVSKKEQFYLFRII